MWLSLVAITVTTLCIVSVSGDMVQQPMEVDARYENGQQDIPGIEKGPEKISTDDEPSMDTPSVQKRTKPKGISGRFKAAMEKRMKALQDGIHSGSGRMYRLADRWVGFAKSHFNEDELRKMVVDIPETPDDDGPQKKLLQGMGEYIKHNLLNDASEDTNV